MSKTMNFKEAHYSVRQKIGDAGFISTQNMFPLSSVTPKPPESQYGVKYLLLAENQVFPEMAGHNWTKPMRKFKKRVYDIKHAGAATSLNAYDYNCRVLPVLSYVAQLIPLPLFFAFEQRVAFHTIYHAPFNTFAHSDFFHPLWYCLFRSCALAYC